METVKGSTLNEINMIKWLQASVGAAPDGEIGTQTISDILCRNNAVKAPLTLQIYNAPVIISKDILVVPYPKAGVGAFTNAVNGSFLSGTTVWSFCISDGKIISDHSCHAAVGYPETVIYRLYNGEFGWVRAKTINELPSNIKWATGGMGLLSKYSPSAEGFCQIPNGQNFSDVTYKNNHVMLGIKNNHTYLVYCNQITGSQVNSLAKLLGFEKAIMLDGGHLAAMNGSEPFAKFNLNTTQYYMLQAI